MTQQRRDFIKTGVGITSSLGIFSLSGIAFANSNDNKASGPLVIATWPFGLDACKEGHRLLTQGKRAMDAVESGIRITEADLTNRWVGIGGYPNAEGVLQLDACVMDGERPRQRSGSVACLEGFKHPISVARLVMEKTPHAIFVGQDAGKLAKKFQCETAETPCPEAKAEWEAWVKKNGGKIPGPNDNPAGHDTIALLALSADGHIAGGCSTSGLKFKMPGRVGDSPIIGGGLYVDEKVGAAGATGTGENILRYCGSFLAVEFMRSGASPEEACRKVIERIVEGEQRPASELSVNFIALDKSGRFGAAGTDKEFILSVVDAKRAEHIKPLHVK